MPNLIDRDKAIASIEYLERKCNIKRWNWFWYMKLILADVKKRISSIHIQQEWIPVSAEILPENEQNVLWTFKNSVWKKIVIRCFYARKFQVEMYDDPYEFWEYNEEKDEYYLPEWWYECNEYEEINYRVSDTVTHWMPLPLPPNN